MTVCRPCSGEAVTIRDGKVKPRGCGECVAQSLIKHNNNPFGIMPLSHAQRLCSCLASGHKEGFEELQEVSETFIKVTGDYSIQKQKEEKEKQEIVFQVDKKKQEEKEYYEKRKSELQQLDIDGTDWMLPERVESGESNESEEIVL